MKLKGLEMQGFKSFPDRTRINFDSGITAVVGPNGSGKSNISDAVRWVLGEMSLKSLRGSKMEDVIFSGSDKRAPANYTSVSLYLDKDDGSGEETVVTRKYYRSGESEYYIDKKQVRLKDVYEAFYDTGIGREGYSVIGQGKIAEVLSKKGDERRSIFEEAAGISKYRYKKLDAEKKLAATEANLLRITDIMAEIGARLAPLEKEAENARRFLSLSEEKKGLEITLWLNKIDEVRAELSKSEELFAAAERGLAEADARIKSIEDDANAAYSLGSEISATIAELERLIAAIGLKISECEGKKALKLNDIAHFERLISDSTAEIESSVLKKTELENGAEAGVFACEEAARLLDEARAVFAEAERIHAEKRELYTKSSVERNDAQRKYTVALEARNRISVEYASVKANLENARRNAESSAEQITGYETRIAEITEKLETLKKQLDDANAVLAEAEQAKAAATEAFNEAEAALDAAKEANSQAVLAIASLKQQKDNLERMEQLLEGYSDSVKNVINAAKEGKIICRNKKAVLHGTVSSVLNTDEKYVVALETALGAAVQYIIVDDEEDAKSCIRYLKETGGGRASFLPITSVRGNEANVEHIKDLPGFIGVGHKLCKYKKEYENIFTKLLGETIVTSDIDSASVIARKCEYKLRIVTLDGQIIHQGGSYTGGSAAKRVGILTRSIDIERLSGIIAEKESAYEKALEETQLLKEKLDERAEALESCELHASLALSKRDSVSNALNIEKVRLEEEKRRYRRYADDTGGVVKELQILTERAEEISVRLKEADENASALAEQVALATRVAESAEKDASIAYEALNKAKIAVIEKENTLARLTEKQRAVAERCKNLEHRIRECRLSIENASEQIKAKELEIVAFDDERAVYEAERQSLNDKIQELLVGKQENEKQTESLRSALREAQLSKEEAFKYYTTLESRKGVLTGEYEAVTARLWDEYELTYSAACAFRLPDESMKKASSRLNQLKNQIRAMGNINVNAVEEYAETKERYDFLKKQTDDLNDTRKSLDNAIEKLEINMKNTFLQTFTQINNAFGEVFAELFGGGSAKCVLEDENAPLTCGIEIELRLPGKKVVNISLLSGGEQSFAAVALYLALQRINPAPFCIFDEIESALDEVNVNRLAQYLRNHSDATQYIMITHRRGTMESADVVYGVTMKEKGVSDYIKLDIRAIEQNSYIK